MSTIDIKMSAIYRASHDVLPLKAAVFAEQAERVTAGINSVVAGVALAGNHPVADDLGELSVELFLQLRHLVRTFNDSAVALDLIADDFVRVDADAQQWFDAHQQYVGDPETVTEPAGPEV
jgi:hypothetical protein